MTGLPHSIITTHSDATRNFAALVRRMQAVPGRAHRNAATKIPNTTWFKLKIDTVDIPDTGKLFDLTNGYYVCPLDGYYQASGEVAMITEGSTGELLSGVRVNEAEVIRGARIGIKEGKPEIAGCPVSGLLKCKAGDKIELWAFNNTGAERAIEQASYNNFLSVVRVG